MSRIHLCERLIAGLGDRAPEMSAEKLSAQLMGWDLIEANGAVVLMNGAEIHVAAIPEIRGKWLTRSVIKSILGGILAKHGKAETLVMKDNADGHAFVKRLGFEKVGESGAAIRYELKELRHA